MLMQMLEAIDGDENVVDFGEGLTVEVLLFDYTLLAKLVERGILFGKSMKLVGCALVVL